ncbi:hypothetical protein Baya_13683 [Bagarius yarrelli]|uniref:Uncharacterized protein n=1 Tax=Bagarius yarrelli TaxID=175774 RepID=A0A556V6N5_BAGYA|nr:hypothetical protein Baya_13683 [Bagarius yarrelli]
MGKLKHLLEKGPGDCRYSFALQGVSVSGTIKVPSRLVSKKEPPGQFLAMKGADHELVQLFTHLMDEWQPSGALKTSMSCHKKSVIQS